MFEVQLILSFKVNLFLFLEASQFSKIDSLCHRASRWGSDSVHTRGDPCKELAMGVLVFRVFNCLAGPDGTVAASGVCPERTYLL